VARAVAARCGQLAAPLPRAAAAGHIEAGVRRGAAAAAAAGLGRGLHTTGGGGARVESQVRQALAHPWEVPEWGPALGGARESSMAMAEREEAMEYEVQDFRQSYVGVAPPSAALQRISPNRASY